ncbi:hypothetical protein TWF481_001733 [Arthrobotrys musiformis]|uniref:Aminoglycoside phosphotransferase domain-containing protein n=1 Tax=Arthrobotrys musiformis TaxID=47236 RepID=A0AAV9VU55_9PEZI
MEPPAVTIPYYAPSAPFPLPTIAEIESGEPFQSRPDHGWKTVFVGEKFMVKCGDSQSVSLIEGEHILFLSRVLESKVKLPVIYALYTDTNSEGQSLNFIVMERVYGACLDTIWPSLEEKSKQVIASTFKAFFQELRSIPAPGYYGSIGRRPVLVGFGDTLRSNGLIDGPFSSQQEFNNAFASNLVKDTSEKPALRLQLYSRMMNKALNDHPACFTYGNFGLDNIVLDGEGGLTIINWQDSGWLPTYWEYITAVCDVEFDDEMHLWIASMIPTFEAEFCVVQTMYRGG